MFRKNKKIIIVNTPKNDCPEDKIKNYLNTNILISRKKILLGGIGLILANNAINSIISRLLIRNTTNNVTKEIQKVLQDINLNEDEIDSDNNNMDNTIDE